MDKIGILEWIEKLERDYNNFLIDEDDNFSENDKLINKALDRLMNEEE